MVSIVNWVSLILVIVGIGMFLYGANVYDATIGWTGIGLGIFGIALYIVAYLIVQLKKKEPTAGSGSRSEPVKPTVFALQVLQVGLWV